MNISVATAVLNQTPLDWHGNLANLESVLKEAARRQVEILCLPELCLSGYGCEDAFHAPDTFHRSWQLLKKVLPLTKGMAVNFGLPIWYQGGVFNCAVLAVSGKLVGAVAKQHLAGDGIHYEPRWFKAWPAGIKNQWLSPDGPLPIGDLILELRQGSQFLRLGFEICEDAWVAARPGGRLAGFAVDVILNPSASHFSFGKQHIRERFVVEGSRAFALTYLYANLNGNEAGRAIYDGGAVIAANGEVLARGPRFSLKEWELTSTQVDITKSRVIRARTASFQPILSNQCEGIVEANFSFANSKAHHITQAPALVWPEGSYAKEEEFTYAVTLGLLDYMRKSKSKGFVISLADGIDSAACAILIYQLYQRLQRELTPEQIKTKLCYWPDYNNSMSELLTTVYQATASSGPITKDAAAELAKNIGCSHHQFEIDKLVSAYKELAQQALDRKLDWKTDDTALQNIQARVRSPGPWLLANILGALLLSPSNRSQAAIGYATMDGDTSGGLAPIAGIDQSFLRSWLLWVEKLGPKNYGSIPALSAINAQELKVEPSSKHNEQTNEAHLMPYPILDRITHLAVSEKLDPKSCYHSLKSDYPDSTSAERKRWIKQFFTLFAGNQWKRERLAPSFHLDEQSLDPKAWLRFPILNGAYRLELEELDGL